MRFNQTFSKLIEFFFPVHLTMQEYDWYKPTYGDEQMYYQIHGHHMSDSDRVRIARQHKLAAIREAKIRKQERKDRERSKS